MARPTATMKYPNHFWDILEELKKDPHNPVVLEFDDEVQRRNVQMDFLGFRQAALKEGHHQKKAVVDPSGAVNEATGEPNSVWVKAEYPDLNAYTTRMSVESREEKIVCLGKEITKHKQRYILKIWHCDYTPEALAVAASMEARYRAYKKAESDS